MTIKMLKAMAGIVDTNHIRFAITGVYVKGGVMQATNAITAARLAVDGLEMPEMIIPVASIKQMRDDGKGLDLLEGGLYRLGGVVFAPIDAQYPDFGRLTPSYHGGHSNSTGSLPRWANCARPPLVCIIYPLPSGCLIQMATRTITILE